MTEKSPRDTDDAAKEKQPADNEAKGQLPVLDLGAIRGALGDITLPDEPLELTPGPNERARHQLEVIKKLVGVPSGLKVYLGSGLDTALAEVYGKDEVVHVDMDDKSIDALKKAGYKGAPLDYEAYAKYSP